MTSRTPETTPYVAPVVSALPPTSTVSFAEALSKVEENAAASTVSSEGISLVLFKDHVQVTLAKGLVRQISYPGLKELIDRSINVKEAVAEVEGMSLPSNVFFMSQSARELRFCCYFPGGNQDMLFEDSKKHIVIPNIIISFILRKEAKDWIVTQAHYMCSDLPVSKLPKTFINGPDNAKGIYLLPMSNTYPEGKMCYGGNNMPARFKDNQFRGLDWYYRYLWVTPFNSDLGIKAIGNVVTPGAWYTALAKLAKENKVFPYRDLSGWRELEGAVPSESAVRNR